MDTTLTEKEGFRGINATFLKYIAITAMLIDHIAWAFVPYNSILGQIMHVIGRITAPTMCYFIAEGYYHTKNVKKYILRLGIFAVISHFTFVFMECGKFVDDHFYTGVIYTLLLGLLALLVCDKVKCIWIKLPLILIICYFAELGDWSYIAVGWILAFGLNRGKPKLQFLWFSIISICMVASMTMPLLTKETTVPFYANFCQLGVFLSIPIILMYNGKLGRGGKFNKWIFYIFYPLHTLLIGLLKFYILK